MKNLDLLYPKCFVILVFTLFLSLLSGVTVRAEAPPAEETAVLNLRFTAGPTGKVCPLQTYTFTASANIPGFYQWNVKQNGIWYPRVPAPLIGPISSTSSFNYTFLPGSGTITVEVSWYINSLGTGTPVKATRTLIMELGEPAPTLALNGLKFCSANESQQITIEGIAPFSSDPNSCDYHYEYVFEVPNGWLVSTPQGVTDQDGSPTRAKTEYYQRTVIVTATNSATNGTMRVSSNHPNFTVQRTSQIRLAYGPYTTSVLNGPSGGSGSSFVQVNAPNLPGLTSGNYQWRVINGQGGTHASQSGGRYFQFYLPPAGFATVEVQLTVPDRCRSTPTAVLKLFIYEYGGSYLVYPNPADDYIDITAQSVEPNSNSISMSDVASIAVEAPSFANSGGDEPLLKPYQVKLLDAQANVLYEGEAQDGKLRIDVSRLKKGNYYIHIREAGKALTKMPILIE